MPFRYYNSAHHGSRPKVGDFLMWTAVTRSLTYSFGSFDTCPEVLAGVKFSSV